MLNISYRTRPAVCIIFSSFFFFTAVYITDHLCTKNGNSSSFKPKIRGLYTRAVTDIPLEYSNAKESEYRFKKYFNPFWLYLVSVHWNHPNINGSHKTHTWALYKFGRGNKETTRSWLILLKATILQTNYNWLV